MQLPAATINALLTDENDHIIALNVNKDDTANANFKVNATALDLTGKETTTYEVNVTKDGVLVDTTEMLYIVKMFIGENKQELELYHRTEKMTKATGTPNANNEYKYDPTTGYVIMCVDTFSPFTSVYDEPVAAIGTTVYYSLESAIAAATDGQTVSLLKNVVLTARITVDKKMTLDLNGKTISAGDGFTPSNSGVIGVKRGGNLTINDATGEGKIQSKEYTYAAVAMTIKGEPETGVSAKLTVNGGTLEGRYYGIVNNGSRHNTEIIVNGGSIIGTDENDSTSIYHPNKGTLTINGGNLIGADGLVVKGGTVNITGGTFTATKQFAAPESAGTSGSATPGCALYVEGNYGYAARVTVTDGTFKSVGVAPSVYLEFNNDPEAKLILKGGTYSSEPNADYVHRDYETTKTSDTTWVVAAKERFASGSGTEDDPFVIEDAWQLSTGMAQQYQLDHSKTTYYKLNADISTSKVYTATLNGTWPAVTPQLSNAVIDGNGHTIELDHTCFAVLISNTTFKNLKIKEIEYPIAMNMANNCKFEDVDVSGYMSVGGNDGAYAIYAYDNGTFKDCDADVTMVGIGGTGDYNAVFVGYSFGTNPTFTFENCVNKGSIVCGRAAMFIGNPCTNSKITLNISNCRNEGTIQSTFSNGSYIMNYYVAAQENSNNWGGSGFTVNEAGPYKSSYPMPEIATDTTVENTGTVKHGPLDTSLKLTQNIDGTFTVNKAATGGVAYYVVSVGLYCRPADNDGSTRFYVNERINATEAETYTSELKNLSFVDKAYVAANPDGTTGSIEGNETYTVNDVTYYVIPAENGHTNGRINGSEIVYVAAYDEYGMLIASANLSD